MAPKRRRRSNRKQPLCHLCKQRPIWSGGDVKEPGPYCKRCYHKSIWPERRRGEVARVLDEAEGIE
jgi:hypothetical protein